MFKHACNKKILIYFFTFCTKHTNCININYIIFYYNIIYTYFLPLIRLTDTADISVPSKKLITLTKNMFFKKSLRIIDLSPLPLFFLTSTINYNYMPIVFQNNQGYLTGFFELYFFL